jgi:hypothetical protein
MQPRPLGHRQFSRFPAARYWLNKQGLGFRSMMEDIRPGGRRVSVDGVKFSRRKWGAAWDPVAKGMECSGSC